MAQSVRTHEPGARVIARLRGAVADTSGWDETAAADTVPELLRHALAGAETAVYLDPAVVVYGPLEPVWKALEHDSVALFPRVRELPDDGRLPGYEQLLEAGRISAACVAVRRGPEAEAFLEWWSRRIEENPERADGGWLELAAERLEGVDVVADPGCGVSFWNLHERTLSRNGSGTLVDGRPLRIAEFEGFRGDRPYWLSEAGTRVLVMDDPVLSELCGEYAQRLRAAGWKPPRRGLADVDRLGNSQRVDHLVRVLWDEALADGEEFGDPLNGPAAEAFVEWLRGPAARGARAGVNRYLFRAYQTRPDLQEAFPDLDGPDGPRLIEWALAHGRREVLGELLPSGDGDAPVPDAQLGVNVIGYLGETLGLAEAARLYVAALSAAGIPVSTTAVKPDLPVADEQAKVSRYGSRAYEDIRGGAEPTFNLACLNGDHLAELLRERGEGILDGRPTIGQWGWETDVLPPSWTEAFDKVDEVWVYSSFMAENLGRLLPMPVVVVPPAIVTPQPSGPLTIAADDRFTFLFMLDLFSTLRRKNPLGLIDAFTRAFEPGEGPRLLIKTINARFRQQAAEELRFRADGHPDVEFVDAYLDPGQKAALLARADCYVSLHRSEGFGLPLAEAMALGTPVIATGYSGNMDFTTPFNSKLVDWTETRVGPDCEIYPPNGRWAEPDPDHAAVQMRHVWEKPEEAAARARRAQADIERLYAPKVAGEIARARLERLADLRAARGSRRSPRLASPSNGALQRVEQAMAFDLRNGVGSPPRGLGGFMRKLVLRLMLPFTHNERAVDRAMLEALRELQDELGGRG